MSYSHDNFTSRNLGRSSNTALVCGLHITPGFQIPNTMRLNVSRGHVRWQLIYLIISHRGCGYYFDWWGESWQQSLGGSRLVDRALASFSWSPSISSPNRVSREILHSPETWISGNKIVNWLGLSVTIPTPPSEIWNRSAIKVQRTSILASYQKHPLLRYKILM